MRHVGRSSTLAIDIKGARVILTVECKDDYEAMMFYDKVAEQLRTGYVRLEFAAPGHEHEIEGGQS